MSVRAAEHRPRDGSGRGAGGASRRAVLLDLLFPPACAACRGAVAPRRGPFCAVCASALEPVPPGCPRCGLPGPAGGCPACLLAPPPFDSCRAGGLFGGPLADAVHLLKYGGRAPAARALGAWLASRAPAPVDAVAVAAVPLARARRVARGYDQAALLAASYARCTGLPLLRGAVRRLRDTAPQVGRTRAERVRNVAGAFVARGRLEGRAVLLVDDVVTTGATAGACAGALRDAGAAAVHVVALARAI